MSDEYFSVKEDVLKKLELNLTEIRERFGIDTIGLFGSVSRGEDSPDSDIDIVYTFKQGRGNLRDYAGVTEYLETLFNRNIDFVSLEWMNPNLKPYVIRDIILVGGEIAAV
ncbi:MAG: nucleotidyltransferase domain-containing protein [Methanocorpusculum sp.]|nr:nucleotidyltransferase domain-containing protein [Methanocorpusculum sp.]